MEELYYSELVGGVAHMSCCLKTNETVVSDPVNPQQQIPASGEHFSIIPPVEPKPKKAKPAARKKPPRPKQRHKQKKARASPKPKKRVKAKPRPKKSAKKLRKKGLFSFLRK